MKIDKNKVIKTNPVIIKESVGIGKYFFIIILVFFLLLLIKL